MKPRDVSVKNGVFSALLVGLALLTAAPAGAAIPCRDDVGKPWCSTRLSPDARAELLTAALTGEERIALLAGDQLDGIFGAPDTHTGTNLGIPRVEIPTLHLTDGPAGVRAGTATAVPSPISVAASFDPAVAALSGALVAGEAREKGNDLVYAPGVNLLRTPLNGRSFEYYGEDPLLAGRLAVAWIRAAQAQGVMANVKHFAANEQEGAPPPAGSPPLTAGAGNRSSVDTRVDERTLRELYLAPFEAAVTDGEVASVMCAYPRVNGAFACENGDLLNRILKGQWGFEGFVLGDYGAPKDTVRSLLGGLDLDVWPAATYTPEKVRAALASGQVSQAVVDEHVRRILRTMFAAGIFDRQPYPDDTDIAEPDAHHALAGRLEERGIVLLRNEGGVLPLSAGGSGRIAVIGPEAAINTSGGGSSLVQAARTTTVLDALRSRLGDRLLSDDGRDAARAAAVARGADVAVVVVGDRASEGSDKPCLALSCGQTDDVDRDALIDAVAAANPRTVVVLQTAGPVLTPWRDEVAGLLEAWYPGQNGGTAIDRVLFGDAEPGGRLPATFPAAEADEPAAGDPEAYPGVPDGTGIGDVVTYKEGVLVGYRWFDAKAKPVAYPFGHGLTYTSFAFSNLKVRSGDVPVVEATVRNTGTRTGTAVPQLYLGLPEPRPGVNQPPWQLKGFRRVTLAPGEAQVVSFGLSRRLRSYWDTVVGDWRVASGCYAVGVGASVRDLPLRGTLGQDAPGCATGSSTPPPTPTTAPSTSRPPVAKPKPPATVPGCQLGRQETMVVRDGRVRVTLLAKATVTVVKFVNGKRNWGSRVVARYRDRTGTAVWNGKPTIKGRRGGEGDYGIEVVSRNRPTRRFSVTIVRGEDKTELWSGPTFETRRDCGPLERVKATRPVFGGASGRALGVSVRLRSRAVVTARVLLDDKVVRRFLPREFGPGVQSLPLAAKGRKRGFYRVQVTATPPSGRGAVTMEVAANRR